MTDVLSYKCPSCGGSINFDIKEQKMRCPYCESVIEMSKLVKADQESESSFNASAWSSSEMAGWDESETDNLREYHCKSCGGELLVDVDTVASACPFCDSPVVMADRVVGSLKPNCVIPFKKNKDDAKAGLSNHFKGKRLLPKVFKDENHIDEVKGIYVPFWLFNAVADAKMRFQGMTVRTWTSGDYEYTETDYYDVAREGSLAFENIEVDGSSKMDDDLMNSIGPYDYSEAVDFQTAYLAGFLADKYDVSADDSICRANEFIKKSTEKAFKSTVTKYSTVITKSSEIDLKDTGYQYALYPVWMLNTTWRGKKYVFAMNGQTGKFVGDLPMDKKLAAGWFVGLATVIAAAVIGINYLMWLI